MPDPTPTTSEETVKEHIETIRKFYRVLNIAHANAVERVMDWDDLEAMASQAKIESDRIYGLSYGPQQCGAGEIWDEKLKRCVAI